MADLLLIGIRYAVAVIFTVAAVSKLRDPEAFRKSLGALGFVPERLAGVIVVAEAITVPLLVFPATARAGLALAATLLLAFAVGISIAKYRGRLVSCRCFGVRTRPLGWPDVARNTSLGALCVIAMVWAQPAPPVAQTLALAAAGGVAGLLITAADDLIKLLKP